MRPYENEVNGLVGEIWSTMLGLDVQPDDRAIALTARDDAIVSRVSITGTWRGTVTLHCDAQLARGLAGAMFGLGPDAASDDMVEDALGELTNMTSGGFKSLLPEPCYLSLPSAGPPEAARPEVMVADEPSRFGFRCLDGAFLVTVDATPEFHG